MRGRIIMWCCLHYHASWTLAKRAHGIRFLGHALVQSMAKKSNKCTAGMPGGACESVTGGCTCTYHTEPAGEIRLDDLVGIDNYHDFSVTGHHLEYNAATDKGEGGCHFWDHRHDQDKCTWRMNEVLKYFKQQYPNLEESLEDPPPCWAQ